MTHRSCKVIQTVRVNALFFSIWRQKTGFAIAINLMYGMASLSSTFALLLVTESSIKSKHVQKVSGVYLSNFWFSALLWDLVNFLLPCVLMLVSLTSDCVHWDETKYRVKLCGDFVSLKIIEEM